jgi:hypothetical protein
MALSGAVTLIALPAIVRLLEKSLFKFAAEPESASCNCALCLILSVAVVLLLAINIHQYTVVGWSKLALLSIIAIPVMALICGIISRRQACKTQDKQKDETEV